VDRSKVSAAGFRVGFPVKHLPAAARERLSRIMSSNPVRMFCVSAKLGLLEEK
jgi:hypothetical protein